MVSILPFVDSNMSSDTIIIDSHTHFDEESSTFRIRDIEYYRDLGFTFGKIFTDQIIQYLDLNTGKFIGDKPALLFINDIITYLYFCDCCNRHSINKPATFTPWYDTPFQNTQLYDDEQHMCTCDCRNTIRWICRSHPDLFCQPCQ